MKAAKQRQRVKAADTSACFHPRVVKHPRDLNVMVLIIEHVTVAALGSIAEEYEVALVCHEELSPEALWVVWPVEVRGPLLIHPISFD